MGAWAAYSSPLIEPENHLFVETFSFQNHVRYSHICFPLINMKSPFALATDMCCHLITKITVYGGQFQICGYDSTFMVIEYKGDHLDCIPNQQNNVDAEHL